MGSRDRRASDKITAELLELIKKESREPEKGVLLILYQMSDLISTNVALVKEVKDSVSAHNSTFEDHRTESLGYLNKVKGAGKILIGSMTLFTSLILAIVGFLYTDYKELKKDVVVVEKSQVSHVKNHLYEYRNRSE